MKNTPSEMDMVEKGVKNRCVERLFFPGLCVYIVLCGYVLVFSGSLFFEAVVKGWFYQSASEFDNTSFWLGYLYGFPSLAGVLSGLSVLFTGWERFYKYKVLLFIPAAVWSTQLVIGNFRWGFIYWTEWLYLVPVMSLSIFILYGAVNKTSMPRLIKRRIERNATT